MGTSMALAEGGFGLCLSQLGSKLKWANERDGTIGACLTYASRVAATSSLRA